MQDLVGFDPDASAIKRSFVVGEEQLTLLGQHLSVRRLLKAHAEENESSGCMGVNELKAALEEVARYQAGLRKTFWIDESLTLELDQTEYTLRRQVISVWKSPSPLRRPVLMSRILG